MASTMMPPGNTNNTSLPDLDASMSQPPVESGGNKQAALKLPKAQTLNERSCGRLGQQH
jgi:hypothetical protein